MITILLVIYEFFKTGLFALGGGLATIPFLGEIAEKYGWYTTRELADMIAISESTPGPIGVNMATYAGFKVFGVFGGIISSFAIVAPSVIIVCIIARFIEKFRSNQYVDNAFDAIRPATAGLIAGAVYEIFAISVLNLSAGFSFSNPLAIINIPAFLLFSVMLVLILTLKKIHPVIFIFAGAAAGIVLKL